MPALTSASTLLYICCAHNIEEFDSRERLHTTAFFGGDGIGGGEGIGGSKTKTVFAHFSVHIDVKAMAFRSNRLSELISNSLLIYVKEYSSES